jgi:hypothetical protein
VSGPLPTRAELLADTFASYRHEITRLETGVHAASFAVGAAGYLLDPTTTYTDTERLVRLATVIDDLREALGLTPATPNHRTSSTDGEAR